MAYTYPRLRNLCLRGCSYITSAGVRRLVALIPGLTELDIGYCNEALLDESIGAITEHCTHLHRLVLRGGKRLGQSSATRLGNWLRLCDLSALDLMGCTRILTDDGLQALFAMRSTQLSDLNLSRRSHLVDSRDPRAYYCSGPSKLTDTTLDLLGQACPALTRLSLADASNISNEGVERLLAKVRTLRALDLHGCSKLRGTRVGAAIILYLPAVEELVLSQWRGNLKDKTMTALAQLKVLQKLDVHDCMCSDKGIASILDGCESLIDLTVSCQLLNVGTLATVLGGRMRELSLIGVDGWWQNHRTYFINAIANATDSACTIYFDSDAKMMQQLQHAVSTICTANPAAKLKSLRDLSVSDSAR